jgi:hypothetical protein
MPKCKHCKETFSPKIVALHEMRCKENPVNKPKKKPAAKKTTTKKTTTKK